MDKRHQINCELTSKASLYQAYMPFVTGGGLFIRTAPVYQLGTLINLSIKLMDESELYQVTCKVVWITLTGAQGNKAPGIGLQFLEENSRCISRKIETYLAEMPKSPQATDTM